MLKRWHTLSGVGPLAVFVLMHLGLQASSLGGEATYTSVSRLTANPIWGAVMGVLALVPLVFHGSYGLWSTFSAPTAGEPKNEQERSTKLVLRLSGFGVLVFVVSHWLQFRYPLITGALKPGEVYGELCASLSSTTPQGIPLMALGYLVGLAATMMHLSYGLGSFLRTFEIPDDPVRLRQIQLAEWATHLFCSLGFALGAAVVIELATGSWFFG